MIVSNFPKELGQEYSYITSWAEYKKRFQQMTPNVSEIESNYQFAKEHYETLVNSSRYNKLLKELNLSATETTLIDPAIEQDIINKIQSSGNLWQFVGKGEQKSSAMQLSRQQALSVLSGWQNILSMASRHQWTSVNTQLSRIESMCNSLVKAIEQNSEFIDMGAIVGMGKGAKSISVANSIQGTLSALRGFVLEEEVKKFLARRLPYSSSVKTYQTGAIKSGGLSIKEDLITLMNNLELKDKDGNVNYIFKDGEILLADGITTAEKVELDKYQLTQLRESPGLGFTAKTSKGQTVYHGGYNINALIDDSVQAGALQNKVYQLAHMYQLGITHQVSVYQNYAVSKLVVNILGKNNVFMVSRSGITPTYLYVERLINNKKYLSFANKEIPKRSKNAGITQKYGSTNIVGPHI